MTKNRSSIATLLADGRPRNLGEIAVSLLGRPYEIGDCYIDFPVEKTYRRPPGARTVILQELQDMTAEDLIRFDEATNTWVNASVSG